MTTIDPVRTAAMALIEATEKHDLSVRDDPVVPARAYDALCSALALPVEQPRVAEPAWPEKRLEETWFANGWNAAIAACKQAYSLAASPSSTEDSNGRDA